jgi:hypothetical protein
MKMQIDFYSKDEMTIQIDFSGRYPFPETETSELFLFACYALRQLSNLGQHLVAKALAGLLVSKSSISSLLQDKVELPSGKDLLFYLKFHATSVVSQTRGIEESVKVSLALDNELNFNNAMMQILDTEFLAGTPRLVRYNGKGKNTFEVTLPPFQLDMKGFGLLGRDVNYYAFHSVIGLIRLLGQKHTDDEAFFNHLIQVAQLCGTAYIFQQIPADQVSLANAILKQVGIS